MIESIFLCIPDITNESSLFIEVMIERRTSHFFIQFYDVYSIEYHTIWDSKNNDELERQVFSNFEKGSQFDFSSITEMDVAATFTPENNAALSSSVNDSLAFWLMIFS